MAASTATQHPLPVTESVHVPDWQALRLFNQYRLMLLLALAAVYYLAEDQRTLGSRDGVLFEVIHLGYLVLTLGFVLLVRLGRPAVSTQCFIQNYLDILLICGLMYASGGVQSGLGPLLLINLALLSHISSIRHAFLFAAIASLVIIGAEMTAQLLTGMDIAQFEAAALLGSLLFATAWVMTVPLRRLMARQLVTPSHSRVVLDVKQIAQLNEEIIRELDSGVVVIDSWGNVQLINDTARALLAVEFVVMPVNVRRLCRELVENMKLSEQSPTRETRAFVVPSTGQSVLPQYIALSNGGMLIKLDDHTHILQQFQQLKLASLGRLSASIAHEIRNPLGAISHAVQLIQESPNLDNNDANLLDVAKRNTQRINRIIEDVLQLSNRQQVRSELVNIDTLIDEFASRFRDEQGLSDDQISIIAETTQAVIDPGHFDQILWNLCTNAQLHNNSTEICITIQCWMSSPGVVAIDIIDNGQGITDMERQNLFEPFYSTHHAGTGLGLFIIRELCVLNNAQIECINSQTGAHFRITLQAAQDMAA